MNLIRRVTLAMIVMGLGLPVLFTASAQQQGGVLRIAELNEPAHLDSYVSILGRYGSFTFAIYDGLLRFDEDMELVAGLAQSWQQLGPTHYRFELHEGITTHAGHTVDAAFVKEWMDDIWRNVEGRPPAFQRAYIQPIEAEVVDRLTVDFHTADVDPELLRYLAIPHFAMYDVRHRNEVGAQAFARAPSGTGPFKFRTWRSGDRVIADANEEYFLGRPYLDEVHFVFVPDLATQIIGLEVGDLEIITDVPGHEIDRLDAERGIKIVVAPEHRTAAYQPNIQDPILSDVRVRRALLHAIDTEGMVEALGARAVPTQGLLADGVFALVPGLVYDFDTELAEQLLNEAGWQRNAQGVFQKDGQPLAVEIQATRGRYPVDFETAEMVQLQLSDFGVRVSMRMYESNAWWDMVRSMPGAETPSHELIGIFYGIRTTIPTAPLERKFSTSGNLNAGQFSDPRYDELMEIAKTAPDEETLRAALEEAQRIVYDNALEWTFFATTNVFAMKDGVHGFDMTPAQNIRMDLVWMESN